MKTKSLSLFTLIAVIVSLVSCKDGEKETKKEEVKDPSVHILIEVLVPKGDNFQIYFNEDGTNDFAAENYVNIDVKGSDKPQLLDFKIPDTFMPKQLRFDIGSNKEQEEIKILSFKMKYFDKEFVCQAPDFWKYFGNNTSIAYTKETATAKMITNLPEGFDPIFGGTSNIPLELEKLYKE